MFKKLFFILVMSISCNAQEIQNTLTKAFLSNDSADYYFKIAKSQIKSASDEGHYYFCKAAKFSSNLDSVKFYGGIAISKFNEVKDYPSLLTVYNNMSIAYQDKGYFEKSIQYRIIGLKKAEQIKDSKYEAFFCYGLAETYHRFESYEKGIEYGLRSLKLNLKENPKNNEQIKNSLNAIAINYDDWNKPNMALKYHYKVFDYIKGKDTLEIYSTYNNIGNTLLKQKKYKESEKWLKRSLLILEANPNHNNKYYGSKSTIYSNLATIAYSQNDFLKAEKLFEKAKLFTQKSNDISKRRNYYQQLILFNKKRNNLEEIIKSQEQYIKLKDSVFEEEKIKSIEELETKYQTEKKEKELLKIKNKLFEEEVQHKIVTSWLYIISVFILFLILFGYLYFRQQKIKNKQQKQEFELKSAILKIEAQNSLHEQRLSISRDLHDNIGAQLTFIISSVENIKHGFTIENLQLLEKLNIISNFSKNTIIELRDTIWALNQDEITFEELQGRVNNFIDKAQNSQSNIVFSFFIDNKLSEMKLSSIQGVNIYRTIQEAINNTLKYAKATTVSISIQQEKEQIKIIVLDNGLGFDTENVKFGNGIKNIKKRIQEINGTFAINSSNKGTLIEVVI